MHGQKRYLTRKMRSSKRPEDEPRRVHHGRRVCGDDERHPARRVAEFLFHALPTYAEATVGKRSHHQKACPPKPVAKVESCFFPVTCHTPPVTLTRLDWLQLRPEPIGFPSPPLDGCPNKSRSLTRIVVRLKRGWTRSRPLARPSRAFAFSQIPFAVSQTAQVPSQRPLCLPVVGQASRLTLTIKLPP